MRTWCQLSVSHQMAKYFPLGTTMWCARLHLTVQVLCKWQSLLSVKSRCNPTWLFIGYICSQASCPTSGQPKSLAIAADSTVFVAEADKVEAIRSNQKLYELTPKYNATLVAASGSTVAVGAEDQKIRLYDWDGKALKELGVLENNKGTISALAFSPDGTLLAAGDVSSF